MQDSEYLGKYVEAIKMIEGNRIIMIGNSDHEFEYVSAGYKKHITDQDIIGKRVKDSEHPGKEYASQLREISLRIYDTKLGASFFVVYKFPNFIKSLCFFYTLNPIINPSTNNAVGLIGEFQILNPYLISRVFSLVSSPALTTIDDITTNLVKLTKREQEILFLLILGYGYKDIAYTISKSPSNKPLTANTVNSIIRRQLFKKFKCATIAELIIKSGQFKALHTIPESLIEFKEGIYELTFHDNELLNQITQQQ